MKRTEKPDDYEKKILNSYKKGEWEDVADMKAAINKHKEYAKETIEKNKYLKIK